MIPLIKKARSLLDKIRKSSKFVIDNNNFDIENYNFIKDRSSRMQEIEEKGSKDYKQFPELMQDTYDALFKNEPKLLEEWQIKPDYLINKVIADKLLESPRYKELRVMTQADELASAVGTEAMSDQLIDWIKEQKDLNDALNDVINAAGGMESADGEEEGEEGEEGKSNKKQTLAEAMKTYEEAMKNFQQVTEDRKLNQSIDRIAAKVKDQVRETSDMISNWGLERSGTYTKRPVNEKMELLNKLRSNQKLQQIARLAGRYRRLALQTKREKVKKGLDETHSITQGDDLGRLIPAEWMRLAHPLTEQQFVADLIEKKTLIYQVKGKEKKARGPVIVCCDESGSMSGLPDVWAKSVGLALLEIAREQKRDFYFIHFSSGERMEQLHTNEFLKNSPFDIEQMLDLCEYFSGGGTEFEPSLDWARTKIGESKTWSKADIIFITDGLEI